MIMQSPLFEKGITNAIYKWSNKEQITCIWGLSSQCTCMPHCLIGLYLQITSSKTKLLRTSRQWQQGIKTREGPFWMWGHVELHRSHMSMKLALGAVAGMGMCHSLPPSERTLYQEVMSVVSRQPLDVIFFRICLSFRANITILLGKCKPMTKQKQFSYGNPQWMTDQGTGTLGWPFPPNLGLL